MSNTLQRSWMLAAVKMAIYNLKMDISVTDFKHHCLEIIREVERTGRSVALTRRGRVVARLAAASAVAGSPDAPPWEILRATGGRLLATADESVLPDRDFSALR